MSNKILNLKKILSEVFDFPAEQITDMDSPETIANWDSFQSLIMFQTLEKATGIYFTIEDLKNIKNVGDIRRLLEKYQITSI